MRVDHAILFVRDMETSVAFYRDGVDGLAFSVGERAGGEGEV